MITCRLKNKIIDYLYGELPQEDVNDFESHLNKCPACSDNLNQLIRTKNLVSNRIRPLPDKESLKNYHQNLTEIYQGDSLLSRFMQNIVIKPPIAVRLAEITVVLIVGIFIGTYFNNTGVPQQKKSEYRVNTRFLKNYLFETELLLLEASNMDSEQNLKQILNDNNCKILLQKTLLLKEQAEKFNKTRLINLLNQLELVLLELSNFEESTIKEELDFVKNNIKDWRLFVELRAINEVILL